jgi:hypothetical protein
MCGSCSLRCHLLRIWEYLMKEVKKPKEFWLDIATPYGDPCDFISNEDPYETAKRTGNEPCVSATNIHVIEYSAYEEIKNNLETVIKIGVEGQREINRKLTVDINKVKSDLSIAIETLTSISKNSCCDTCQEAKRVALSALKRL